MTPENFVWSRVRQFCMRLIFYCMRSKQAWAGYRFPGTPWFGEVSVLPPLIFSVITFLRYVLSCPRKCRNATGRVSIVASNGKNVLMKQKAFHFSVLYASHPYYHIAKLVKVKFSVQMCCHFLLKLNTENTANQRCVKPTSWIHWWNHCKRI